MANIALLTADTENAAATNTKSALEAKDHTVTLVDEDDAGTTDFSTFDCIVVVRASATETIAGHLRTAIDTGVPAVIGLLSNGITAGSSRTSLPKIMDLCGNAIVQSSTAGHTEINITDNEHAVTDGFNLGALQVVSSANWSVVMDEGATHVGTALANGDPDDFTHAAGDRVSMFAVPDGTADQAEETVGAAVVCGGWIYAGQSAYTADGQTLLDQAVEWAINNTGTVSGGSPRGRGRGRTARLSPSLLGGL